MAGFVLKIKTKTGQQIINNLNQNSTVKELKQLLSSLSNVPASRLQVLSGYPPKILNIGKDNETIETCGISSGDILILEEKPEPIIENQDVPMLLNNLDTPIDSPGILMKHVVPSDNSCLFTSLYFVLNGKVDESGSVNPYLRQLVAEAIQNDTTFNEAVLGKPVDAYCAWILDDKSWGGAIELAILANHYGIEIAVIDTINAIINKFGEDQHYAHRVFLLFDGIHYDAIYLDPLNGGKIQTIFPAEDDGILRQAEQLAQEAKSSRQYTDVEKFTLKCMVCNIFLKGQVAAQQHAQVTGHASYGEV